MTERAQFISMLQNAKIEYVLKYDHYGWHSVVKIPGDRMFCFAEDESLATIKDYDDQGRFDEM